MFYPLITIFFAFSFIFFRFITNNGNYGSLFSLLLLTIYQNINVNAVKAAYLSNNLSMHIRENTDFPQQKPLQLWSAEANLEGCLDVWFLPKK